jgi:peptidoglycan/LPS O-acetylase OafA/YrhL
MPGRVDASQAVRQQPAVLPRLTSTRAVAALAVFGFHLGHYGVVSRQYLPFAYTMLAYFFVLSGFVLTWTTGPGTRLGTYYRRRFARVWPNHLVMLMVALVAPVTVHAVTAPAFLANLFLVQAWVPDGDVIFGMNAISWSLSVEVAFYAVLPFVVPRLARMSSRGRWLTAGGVFAVNAVFVLLAAHAGGNLATAGHTLPVLRAGEFLLGSVAALEMRRGWRLPGRTAALVATACLAAAILLPHPLPSLNVFLTPLWVVFIVRCVQADLAQRSSPLTWRWLVYAGQLAFAFYLVHDLVILNFQHWFDLSPYALVALMLAGSTLGAVALHHGVEQPAQRWLAGLGRRGTSDGPA